MNIPVYGPESSSGYHVELVVPAELKIEMAALSDGFSGEPCAIERHVDRAALYTPWIAAEGDWSVIAEMRMERLGIPAQALLISSATTGVLLAGLLAGAYSNATMAPAAPVLLAASAFAAGLGFSAGEHSLMRGIFFPVRLLMAVSLSCALAAAAAVAFDFGEGSAFWLWETAAVGSGLTTVIMSLAFIRAAPLRRSERRIR